MKRKNKIFIISAVLVFLIMAIAALNMPTYIKQGHNYTITRIKMPLYIKLMNFVCRDFEYRRITGDIIRGKAADEEKVLAIFDWTVNNIKHKPRELPSVDDHVLNIIIRGYGTEDQSQDVFTTLCSYAGFLATIDKLYTLDKKAAILVSVVKINDKWAILDTYNNVYFRTNNGNIASIEELIARPSLLNEARTDLIVRGRSYKDYYEGLEPFSPGQTWRPKLQMPLQRLIYEIKSKFSPDK